MLTELFFFTIFIQIFFILIFFTNSPKLYSRFSTSRQRNKVPCFIFFRAEIPSRTALRSPTLHYPLRLQTNSVPRSRILSYPKILTLKHHLMCRGEEEKQLPV